jgi:hypothetical protein
MIMWLQRVVCFIEVVCPWERYISPAQAATRLLADKVCCRTKSWFKSTKRTAALMGRN